MRRSIGAMSDGPSTWAAGCPMIQSNSDISKCSGPAKSLAYIRVAYIRNSLISKSGRRTCIYPNFAYKQKILHISEFLFYFILFINFFCLLLLYIECHIFLLQLRASFL